MRVYREIDADLQTLRGAPVAVLGYGNQGRAHALNLRDSGIDVVVGQRDGGRGAALARADGFVPRAVGEAASVADLSIMALPDDAAPLIYSADIARRLRPGAALGFIHGYNLHFGHITPPAGVDVVLIAPKGPGALLRSAFQDGRGIAALMAVHQNATGMAKARGLAWAHGIGCTRVGVIEATVAHETVTDLFGEQAVLCGGMIELMKSAYDTLTAAGYPAEIAYIECIHEMKQVADLIYAEGIDGMRKRISSAARYGGLVSGPVLVDERVRAAMRRLLDEIEQGRFAQRAADDLAEGGAEHAALLKAEQSHSAMEVRRRLAAELQGMFPAVE